MLLQPSLAEKKTLEIAHTFPDDGKAITNPKHYESIKPSPVIIRKEGEAAAMHSPAEKVRVRQKEGHVIQLWVIRLSIISFSLKQ